jgi:hypothetical protein
MHCPCRAKWYNALQVGHLIPAAVHVETVAEVLLAAGGWSGVELCRAVVLRLVLHSCSPNIRVAAER